MNCCAHSQSDCAAAAEAGAITSNFTWTEGGHMMSGGYCVTADLNGTHSGGGRRTLEWGPRHVT